MLAPDPSSARNFALVSVVQPARGKTQHTKLRREIAHEGKDHPRGERRTVNHTPTNTTASPRMGVSPVKGVGRKRGTG